MQAEELQKDTKSFCSIDDERQLIDSLSNLFGIGKNIPPFHDIVFEIEGSDKIYACRGVLMVQSAFFTELLSSAKKQVTIQNVSFAAFAAIIEFLMTGTLNLQTGDLETLCEIVDYCINNDIQPVLKRASQIVNNVMQGILNRGDVEAALDLLQSLRGKKISIADEEMARLNEFLLGGLGELFAQRIPPYQKLSREMVKELLEEYSIALPEKDIFQRVIEWAIVKMTQLDVQREEDENYVAAKITENERPIISYVDAKSMEQEEHIFGAQQVRQFVNDLIQFIQFEYIDMQSIIQTVMPTKIFTSDEVIEFIRAGTSTQGPYTLLGVEYTTPRTRRIELKKTGNAKATFLRDRWEFPLAPFPQFRDKRISLPDFSFHGTTWYPVVIPTLTNNADYLSCYLYNREISEGNKLSTPIDMTITFRLVNFDNPSQSREKKFTKVWQDVKAWGFHNIIPFSDLHRADKGWTRNDKVAIEIELEVNQT
jgi:hypothetical protein